MAPEFDVSVIDDILRWAAQRDLSQKELAARAGLSQEGLSRMKKRGSARLSVVQKLARAAGLRLTIVPETPGVPTNGTDADRCDSTTRPTRFRDRHPELVWSNRGADDAIYIQRALLDPRFTTLLDAAQEFGVDRLEREWDALMSTPSKEAVRARAATSRILRNIRRGYEQASS